MKVILGLGNPGREYEQTRHNVGWWVLDHLADVWRLDGWRRDGETLALSGNVAGQPVRMVKPLTYMNLSGQVLRPYLRRPAWSASADLMVVVDEVAIPVGTYRLRARGSAGGHNGLKDVIAHLGEDFWRIRVGIGHPGHRDEVIDYVLQRASAVDERLMREAIELAVAEFPRLLTEGAEKMMNRLHTAPPAAQQ